MILGKVYKSGTIRLRRKLHFKSGTIPPLLKSCFPYFVYEFPFLIFVFRWKLDFSNIVKSGLKYKNCTFEIVGS